MTQIATFFALQELAARGYVNVRADYAPAIAEAAKARGLQLFEAACDPSAKVIHLYIK